ncbi:MAG: hypothetical protein ABUS57_01870 [Pseudomonadota bacterium]
MRIIMASLLAWAALAAGASAQDFVAQPGLSNLSVDLDTQTGNYSEWADRDLCGINALRAQITIPRLGQDQRWIPAASFFVRRGDNFVGIQFASPARLRPFSAELVQHTGGTTVQTPLNQSFVLDQPVDVALDWTAAGMVTVTVAGQSRQIDLGGAPDSVSISNSTSEAAIQPLRLGHVGPAPVCAAH